MNSGKSCVVCGETLDLENHSRCFFCGGSFRSSWSQEASTKSCGRSFAHQEAQGLVFLCGRCAAPLGERP